MMNRQVLVRLSALVLITLLAGATAFLSH
jgi:hypothetical protein